jgi:sterol desaturase/sphingolipid hydroxylase (fatty acid hydroxylase superfamily)
MGDSAAWWYVFAIAFVAVALAESFLPGYSVSSSTPRRWINNSIMMVVTSFLDFCVYQLSGIALAISIQAGSRGALARLHVPYWLAIVITFAAIDLAGYFTHRFFHALAPMWRLHQIHHSETDLDLTTGIRFHPVEALISQGLRLVVIAALGLPPGALAITGLVVIVVDLVTHANLRLPEFADRCLRLVFITPAMHRAHHSALIEHQNSNFGTMFSLWDHIFGTYSAPRPDGADTSRFGLTELSNGSSLNAAYFLILPF